MRGTPEIKKPTFAGCRTAVIEGVRSLPMAGFYTLRYLVMPYVLLSDQQIARSEPTSDLPAFERTVHEEMKHLVKLDWLRVLAAGSLALGQPHPGWYALTAYYALDTLLLSFRRAHYGRINLLGQ